MLGELCYAWTLNEGEKFEWKDNQYTLVGFFAGDNLKVRRDGAHVDEMFNPYALVRRLT